MSARRPARGIAVCNTPDVLSVATAETRAAADPGRGAARRRRRAADPGRTLARLGADPVARGRRGGRRLGIFGMGRIGRELARLARGIGMTIHYRDMARLPPALEAGAIFHDTDASFLAACDVLSLNAPGGEATRHWLNAERIAKLPRGAVVVNAARGTLVDDAALIAALRSGQVGFAGLDVLRGRAAG